LSEATAYDLEIGQKWIKPSAPVPTVVEIVGYSQSVEHEGNTVTVKYGRRVVTLPCSLFFSQGFRRYR
jgi:hypothetical protein